MMASRPTGLSGMAYCYFASYRTNGVRVWDWRRFIVFCIVPIIFGYLLFRQFDRPSEATLVMIVAVLSVLAAVLLGLLPLAHGIVGQANTDRKYAVGEKALALQELNRIQTLQDLHAAISWAVVLLVVALGCCAILGLLPDAATVQSVKLLSCVSAIILVILYSIICSTALTFFDVARGVFEGMESHSEAIKTKIKNNIKNVATDEEEA